MYIKDSPVLGSGRGNSHGSVPTVDTLHFKQRALLILLVGEADKSVASRLSGLLIRHNLGRLAGRESSLEECDEDEFVDLVA